MSCPSLRVSISSIQNGDARFFCAPEFAESQAFAGCIDGMGGRPRLPVGSLLCDGDRPLFLAVGNGVMPWPGLPHAVMGCWLRALADMCDTAGDGITLSAAKTGLSIAWVTLSDKGSVGQREDASGPLIARLARETLAVGYTQGYLLPDNVAELKALVVDLALTQEYDVIFTTGGTGLGPRDTTPEAVSGLLEKRLYGFEQAMMTASLSKTPHAMLSRAVAGTLGRSLLITLPGSRKAVAENLEAVLPAVAHAVAKLQGDDTSCGG